MSRPEKGDTGPNQRFHPSLVYRAARLYYLEDATQAEIAAQLGTSRPTVSRLLSEARATGIVHVEVREPAQASATATAETLRSSLGLRAAYVAPSVPGLALGPLLEDVTGRAILGAELQPGDTLLVSSGVTVYAATQHSLPALPGVFLAPTIGGIDESEAHYQTNEITRAMAVKVHGSPVLLYAPALPSEELWQVLHDDPVTLRVTRMWKTARAVLLGIGGPPSRRRSIPAVIAPHAPTLDKAVGDICARPYDLKGQPINFPGVERMMAMKLEDLPHVQHSIALAIGADKVASILTAARAGYFNTLVTDTNTAELLLKARSSASSSSQTTRAGST